MGGCRREGGAGKGTEVPLGESGPWPLGGAASRFPASLTVTSTVPTAERELRSRNRSYRILGSALVNTWSFRCILESTQNQGCPYSLP